MIAAMLAICLAAGPPGPCTRASMEDILMAAQVAGIQQDVPVELLLAQGEIESRFRRGDTGKVGEWGVWQLNPRQRWYRAARRACDRWPEQCTLFQATEAAKLLGMGRKRCGSWTGALTSYSHKGGPCHESKYSRRVMAAWKRWEAI